MAVAIVEDADGWSLLEHESRVDQVQIDFRFGLLLNGGTRIVIETPFVATIDGAAIEVDPETGKGVGTALALLHRDVCNLRAFRSGALRIDFSDGGRIEVPPGGHYENWDVVLPDGSQFIGLPGGKVTMFLRTK